MIRKLSILVIELMLVCASPVWAGSTGNGGAQQGAQGQYAFCYGGNVKAVYFTAIFTLSQSTSASNLGVANLATAYGDYVSKTYGLPGVDRLRCVTANSKADAATEKRRYSGMFGTTKIVEIEWAGDSAGTR